MTTPETIDRPTASAKASPSPAAAQPSQGVIGFPTALATTVGLIMASPVILTVTSGFGMGGGAFAVAVVIAFVLMQAQATSFAEAAAILPTTGSVYDYIACGLGRFWAIVGTISAYVLVHVFAGTAVTILSGTMALVNFDSLNLAFEQTGMGWLVGVGMVLLFAIVNAFGIQLFSRIEIALTLGVWITLTVFGVLGVVSPPSSGVEGLFGASKIGTSAPAVLSLIGMAMFMFVGFEFVTPLAVELRHPARQIPRAMCIGLCAVASCMLLYGSATVRHVANVPVGPEGTLHVLDTPLAVPRLAERLMGSVGKVWLGIGFLLAGAATINTIMAGLPRILYGMAIDGALPKAFGYLHPRFKTPLTGIAVAAAIPCLHAWWLGGKGDRLTNLVLAAICAWGFSYALVTLSVVALRLRRPDLPRPYKSPWFPIPQIVSIIGIAIAVGYIAPPGTNTSDIYVPFGVMLAITGIYAFVWLRFVRGVPLFAPVSVEEVLKK